MKILKAVFALLRDAGMKWSEDKASIFAAALAYYTIFSLAPLLILVVAFAKRILVRQDVQLLILDFVSENLGEQVTTIVSGLLETTGQNSSTLLATIISSVVLIWGATGVFNHLKRALNTIWGVEPELPNGLSGVIYFVKTRLSAFLLIMGIGFLLVMTFLLNTLLSTIEDIIVDFFPGFSAVVTNQPASLLIYLVMPAILFAVIFHSLPDAHVAWRDVWLGAAVTAVLFALGNYLISIYLRYTSVASAYGAAGSLIVTLLWIYYSAQIFFYGAEFTQVYANRYGSKVKPSSKAIAVRRQRVEHIIPPAPLMPDFLYETYETYEIAPPVESPLRQRAKQLGFALLGLATGLMIGFIASLKKNS
jgi:membrane protein